MLIGKETIRRAIEFGGPAYLPGTLGVEYRLLQEQDSKKLQRIQALQAEFHADILGGLDVARSGDMSRRADGLLCWEDEWGTGWADDGHGAKTVSHPLEPGYDRLNAYAFPDPWLPGRFAKADQILENRGDCYVRAPVWFTLFERLWMLRGFENMLIDPYLEPRNFARLRDRIVEYDLAIIDQYVARGIDGIFFSDDWGSQRALLINPDDWRRFYRPAYQTLFRRVRDGGAHVWMHLCGNIVAILPDLIDLGLNVLNPVQPQAMAVRELSALFGGKVCFNGGVDVQGTLITGTPAAVKREVADLVELFRKFNGGYILGTSHSIMPETPLDNIIALYEQFLEYQK